MATIARAASAIDGGPSRIAQRAALAALEPAQADAETTALRTVFTAKVRRRRHARAGEGRRGRAGACVASMTTRAARPRSAT